MRSTPSRRSDASSSRRMLAGSPTRRGVASRSSSSHTSPHLVNTKGRSFPGRSRSARATTSSECPNPYTAAVSIQLMPRSTACRIAATESPSSCVPQPKAYPAPPIAHAPKPTRVISIPVVPSGFVGSPVVDLPAISASSRVCCVLLKGNCAFGHAPGWRRGRAAAP